MKEKLIKLIRQGKTDQVFKDGEEFLSTIKDYYYDWTVPNGTRKWEVPILL